MADNPLVGNGVPTDDRHVAYGLRNPFRFTFRPGTNEIWVGDVGWNTWEEIDRIPDPRDATIENFGWPCYEGAARQSAWDNLNVEHVRAALRRRQRGGDSAVLGISPRRLARSCAMPGGGSAVTGLAFAGAPYPVAYHGGLFVADYANACLWIMMPGTNGLPDPPTSGRSCPVSPPSTWISGPNGRLYYVDIGAGTVSRLDSFGGNQPPIALFSATPPYGATPLAVQFDASARPMTLRSPA